MKSRTLLFVILGWSLGCAGIDQLLEDPAPPAEERVVQTDCGALEKLVRLPEATVACRFSYHPRGSGSGWVPGPTDYKLVAWVELSANDELDDRYGEGQPASSTLITAEEAEVLPQEMRDKFPSKPSGQRKLSGIVRHPQTAGPLHVTAVVEVGSAVLIQGTTM